MAVRNILKDQDETLRKISRPVAAIDARILELAQDMIDTMKAADGVGLAAPQVGILRRMVVIDVGQGPMVLINPELVRKSGKQITSEACLSLPGLRCDVQRPMKVTVSGVDLEGMGVTYTGNGLFARAVCHEIDHLNGILFIDHAQKS